ncbi:MAG: flagellar FlbD family protein [Elusimicrobia bacterium]|nr:flagellar FlbD family protein [Elusimicrobiota bacterium]
MPAVLRAPRLMITLHKLNGTAVVINAEIIEALEIGQETVVCLATGNRYLVRESAEEITKKVLEYRQAVNAQGKVVNPIQGFERKSP